MVGHGLGETNAEPQLIGTTRVQQLMRSVATGRHKILERYEMKKLIATMIGLGLVLAPFAEAGQKAGKPGKSGKPGKQKKRKRVGKSGNN